MAAPLYKINKPHLLGIEALTALDIAMILDRAKSLSAANFRIDKKLSPLADRTVINLFFEPSTRTQTSFELAAKKLGADVISMNIASSSVKKGETLLDTAMTLNAMKPTVLIVRHSDSGAVQLLAEKVNCGVINAGDGTHEHPTQALLDALTIRSRKGRLQDLTVAICGDILHSRVARSNILLLTRMGASVRLIAPPTLLPVGIASDNVTIYSSMIEGLREVDVVMMLRVQNERLNGQFFPSAREYYHYFGLDAKKLGLAKPDAIVMHPGPMNRGVEIDSAIADDITRSVIYQQVELGVSIRMACLEIIADYHVTQPGGAR